MRKLIAVGVLIGGLLAGAGTAMAQQGGNADPLSLAASGVLIPFITGGPAGNVALVEVASPVEPNPNLHMVFFNTTCTRVGSASLPETTNDIGFVDVLSTLAPTVVSGIVAIAGTGFGNELIPLSSAIHSRVYVFGTVDGRSRILEPIILDSFEFPTTFDQFGNDGPHTWSPMRTGATFYAPLETLTVNTVLTLVCPRTTIQNGTTTNIGVFPVQLTFPGGGFQGFPKILPAFNSGTTPMSGRVYDTNEILLRDINFTCDCLTEVSVATFTGGSVYSELTDPLNDVGLIQVGARLGTYTELEVTDPNPDTGSTKGSFTGYRNVATIKSSLNAFFGRLSDGSRRALNDNFFGFR